ncbi:MAG: hypothetical protein GY927_03475 [bacterium]|nr:hypothetical protein [bacterium]
MSSVLADTVLLNQVSASDEVIVTIAKKRKAKPRVVIFGRDDRTPVAPKNFWLADQIGLLIDQKKSRSCTAFCIGERAIATASHCVLSRKKKKWGVAIDNLKFILVPAKYHIASTKLKGVTKEQKSLAMWQLYQKFHDKNDAPRHSFLAGLNEEGMARQVTSGNSRFSRSQRFLLKDWAVARLRMPICQRGLELLTLSDKELRKANRQKRIFIAGYHGDKPNAGLLISRNCSVRPSRKSSKNQLYHTCDISSGSSGSPILVETDKGVSVIGINVGFRQRYRLWKKGKRVVRKKFTSKIGLGVSSHAFKRYAQSIKSNTIYLERKTVREVQSLLTRAGFDPGPIDGAMGPMSIRAIQAVQKRIGMRDTGQPNQQVLENLRYMGKRLDRLPRRFRSDVKKQIICLDIPRTRLRGWIKKQRMELSACLLSRGQIAFLQKLPVWSKQTVAPNEQVTCYLTAKKRVSQTTAEKCDEELGHKQLSGNRIKSMKTILDFLGYTVGRLDGQFTQKTSKAIRAFERNNDIAVTGLPRTGILRRLETFAKTQLGDPHLYYKATHCHLVRGHALFVAGGPKNKRLHNCQSNDNFVDKFARFPIRRTADKIPAGIKPDDYVTCRLPDEDVTIKANMCVRENGKIIR